MQAFPRKNFAGAPLALDNYIAGLILVNVACGIPPKAAFAMESISSRTYARYLQRARSYNAGAPDALPEHVDLLEIDRYLFAYFELQSMALELASVQRAKVEIQLMQGSPTRKLISRTISKTQQVLSSGGQIVTLYGETKVQGSDLKEHRPKVTPRIFQNEEG
ncbi:MAG TPA: hypothetical protein VGL56_18865 [Fimbriimonadaceae bacterium]